MIWGCITLYGPGHLHRIEGIMDAPKYVNILKSSLIDTLHDFNVKPQAIYFQQDNDPKHTSKLTKAYLASKKIDTLNWPPNSPDMSSIKNAWNYLDHILHLRNPLPQKVEQLWAALEEEWGKLGEAYITKLYYSIPDCVAALMAAKGGATHY